MSFLASDYNTRYLLKTRATWYACQTNSWVAWVSWTWRARWRNVTGGFQGRVCGIWMLRFIWRWTEVGWSWLPIGITTASSNWRLHRWPLSRKSFQLPMAWRDSPDCVCRKIPDCCTWMGRMETYTRLLCRSTVEELSRFVTFHVETMYSYDRRSWYWHIYDMFLWQNITGLLTLTLK